VPCATFRGSDSVEEQGGTHRNATSKKCWEKQKLLSSGLFRFRWVAELWRDEQG
jgi:hypothetical protein